MPIAVAHLARHEFKVSQKAKNAFFGHFWKSTPICRYGYEEYLCLIKYCDLWIFHVKITCFYHPLVDNLPVWLNSFSKWGHSVGHLLALLELRWCKLSNKCPLLHSPILHCSVITVIDMLVLFLLLSLYLLWDILAKFASKIFWLWWTYFYFWIILSIVLLKSIHWFYMNVILHWGLFYSYSINNMRNKFLLFYQFTSWW